MIDQSKLNAIFRKSQDDFLLTLSEKFEESMTSYLMLCLNMDEENTDILKRFFHSLKGTAATFKFMKLSKIGNILETYMEDTVDKNYKYYFNIAKGLGSAYKEYQYLYSKFIENTDLEDELDSLSNLNILIIDDDTSLINFVKLTLEAHNYTVHSTKKAKEAYSILDKEPIDIVLLSVILSDISGFEIYKKLTLEKFDVGILFLTSVDFKEENIDISDEDYIKKPIDVNVMVEKIENLAKTINIKPKQNFSNNTSDIGIINSTTKSDEYNQILDISTLTSKKNTTSDTPFKNNETKASSIDSNGKRRVLLIEDDEIMLHLLEGALGDYFEFIYAPDGEKGLDLYFKLLPEIVITDLMLPKIDGFEVCKKIREYSSSNKTKLIVLSAKKNEDTIINSFELGIDEYITKPFNVNELLIRIKKLFY